MQNIGKVFEEQIKKSIPSYVLLYRLPDAAQSFDRNSGLRFSHKNPFDYIMWDSKQKILFALELKTVQGKSISFERDKTEKGTIHFHQIDGLNKWNKYDGIICGFFIEFRQLEKTVFIDIDSFNKLISCVQKKSFCFDDLDYFEIPYIIIGQKMNRTRYTYDIESFLKQIKG